MGLSRRADPPKEGGIGILGTGSGGGEGQGALGLGGTRLPRFVEMPNGLNGPGARVTTLSVSGALSAVLVNEVVGTHLVAEYRCHEQALRTTSRAEGKVVVQFDIASSGLVSTAQSVESTYPAEGASECILDGIRRLRFPAFQGEVIHVRLQFEFWPGKARRSGERVGGR